MHKKSEDSESCAEIQCIHRNLSCPFQHTQSVALKSIGSFAFCRASPSDGKGTKMQKRENLQTSSESKQYYIPMEVTAETVQDFGFKPTDVVWTKIGIRRLPVIMIPVTAEQYYEYMRPLWREDKRQQRQEAMASLDKMYEENEYEAADTSDLEANVMKKIMIDELYKALDDLEEIDRTIMVMYSTNHSEAEIGQSVGMSQRGVGKRKQRILLKLRTRLQD